MEKDNNQYHWYLITYTYFNQNNIGMGNGEIFARRKEKKLTRDDLNQFRQLGSETIKSSRQIVINPDDIVITHISNLGYMTTEEFDGEQN